MYNEMNKQDLHNVPYPGLERNKGLANANAPHSEALLQVTLKRLSGIVSTNDNIISDMLSTFNKLRSEPSTLANDKKDPAPINGLLGELDNYVEILQLQSEKMEYILTRLKNIIG